MMAAHLEPRLFFSADSMIYTSHTLRNWLWHLHGTLLCIAFLLLFPLGVYAIRSESRYAFRYHWLLQTSATILALTGIAVGILVSKGIVLLHQYLGLGLGLVLLAQPLLGLKHHIDFVKIKRRTAFSLAHVWSGRVGIAISWVNILMGLVLRGYGFLVQAGAGVAMLCLTVLWGLWGLGVFGKSPAVRIQTLDEREDREGLMTGVGNEFALDDFDEEDEDGAREDHQLKTH